MYKLELAGAIILNKDKEILLMHRNTDDIKQWELPGGKKEQNENTEETAIRELKEELDIDINIEKYIGYKEFEYNNALLKYHWYKARIKNGVPKIMEDKFDMIKYFSKVELLNKKDLSANLKIMIETIDIEWL